MNLCGNILGVKLKFSLFLIDQSEIYSAKIQQTYKTLPIKLLLQLVITDANDSKEVLVFSPTTGCFKKRQPMKIWLYQSENI